jgi:hypothetical protein
LERIVISKGDLVGLSLLGALVTWVSPASAVPIVQVFTSKASFDLAVGATETETFTGVFTPTIGASGGLLWTLQDFTIVSPYDTDSSDNNTGISNGFFRGQPTGILADIFTFTSD